MRGSLVPFLRTLCPGLANLRPIVQRRRVEVRAIGPNHSANFFVDPHEIEEAQVAQRPIQSAGQNSREVDCLLGVILELQCAM